MNKVQKNAVVALEAALKRCANTGVSLYGVDESLIAWTGTEVLPIERIVNDELSVHVKNHGAYVDSGGA